MTDGPQLGDVWEYPFLWSREANDGETAGRKQRPCALALLLPTEPIQVLLVPITTKPPDKRRSYLEIPDIEKKRGGLNINLRQWVITDEFNLDVVEDSYYLEPTGRLGKFGRTFVKKVQGQMIQAIQAKQSKQTYRK